MGFSLNTRSLKKKKKKYHTQSCTANHVPIKYYKQKKIFKGGGEKAEGCVRKGMLATSKKFQTDVVSTEL